MQTMPAADVSKRSGRLMEALTYLREHMPLFAGVNEESLAALADGSELLAFKVGQAVIFKGASVGGLHIVLSGRAGVYVQETNQAPVRVVELGVGEVFGEISIVEWGRAGAMVEAESDLLVLMIPREPFPNILHRDEGLAVRVNILTTLRRTAHASVDE